MSHCPLRRIVACVGGLLIAVVFASGSAANQAAPPSPPTTVAYTHHVTLTVTGGTGTTPYALTANPNIALRPPRSNLTWQIKGQPAKYSIVIEFSVTNAAKGPFDRDPTAADNPEKGKYSNKATGKDSIQTAIAGEKTEDVAWKYSVVLRDANDKDVIAIDPIVIFK